MSTGSTSKEDTMDKQLNDLELSTSSAANTVQTESTSKLIRVPMVVLNRIDEQTLLNLKTSTLSKKSHKKVTKVSDKVKKGLKRSLSKTNDKEVKRVRGRPKKTNAESTIATLKKNNVKLGAKNKMAPIKRSVYSKNSPNLKLKNKTRPLNKDEVKLKGKPGMLKKTLLQKRSKVLIPQVKKPKATPIKATKTQSPVGAKQAPPKPKLEIIQSKLGDNSSDSSGDEFLYDELIEEIENTANKRVVETKPVPEKTTITLKPNVGNKPPTVLKGGIVKKTDLPSNLNLFAPTTTNASSVITNGLQKPNKNQVITPSGKRKNSGIFLQSEPAKKPSPWPVSLVSSPKKSPATNLNSKKKKDSTTHVGVSQLITKPTTIVSPKNTVSTSFPFETILQPISPSKSITLGVSKQKIGPKQTAKVVPLSKSFDADEYLSDEYLEEETLECDEVVLVPKESQTKSNSGKPKTPSTGRSVDEDANHDLLKILTDDSEEPINTQSIKSNEMPVKSKVDIPTSSLEEKAAPPVPAETCFDATSGQSKDVETEEAPVRTIYDLMNDVFLEYPSWNLHIIPETSAFCIAQVTKGRLGLPTLKKCIELDPVTYSAKVYIHQYHIKRFDAVYDGEESILALIQEIDSIKA